MASASGVRTVATDEQVRRWYMESFAAEVWDRYTVGAAGPIIADMAERLSIRQGDALRMHMFRSWEPEARPSFLQSFRASFSERFLAPMQICSCIADDELSTAVDSEHRSGSSLRPGISGGLP